jgi:hypothetical protein
MLWSRRLRILHRNKWLLSRGQHLDKTSKEDSKTTGRNPTLDLLNLILALGQLNVTLIQATTQNITTKLAFFEKSMVTDLTSEGNESTPGNRALTPMDDHSGPRSTQWMSRHLLQRTRQS